MQGVPKGANGQLNRKIEVVREPKSLMDMVIPCQALVDTMSKKWYNDFGGDTDERIIRRLQDYRKAGQKEQQQILPDQMHEVRS